VTQSPPETTTPGARRRRWAKPVAWVGGIIVGLAAIFFVADAVIRTVAEHVVADEVTKQLPVGIKADDLNVEIDGFSVIGQYLAGSFQRVRLESDNVRVNGVPLKASVTAYGVSPDLSKPVGTVTGTLAIGQSAVNKLVQIPGTDSTLTLGNDTLGVTGSASVLGFPLEFTATVRPTIAGGGYIDLTPVKVSVNAASAPVDLTKVTDGILGNKPFPVCVAQYLPEDVFVADLDITKGEASVTVVGSDLTLEAETFASHGSCS
jgi:hypothetical protein